MRYYRTHLSFLAILVGCWGIELDLSAQPPSAPIIQPEHSSDQPGASRGTGERRPLAVTEITSPSNGTVGESRPDEAGPPEDSQPPGPDNQSSERHTPALLLETLVPATVGIGEQFSYQIVVRNLGNDPISQVRIEEEVPAGMTILSAEPAFETDHGNQNGAGQRRTVWKIGSLSAGEEKRIRVRARAMEEGNLRTHPTVTFSARGGMATTVTRPQMSVAINSPKVTRMGEKVPFQIHLTNTGTGIARRILIQAVLSSGLKHPQGSVIEAELPPMKPSESKTVDLSVEAVQPGNQTCKLTVTLLDGTGARNDQGIAAVEHRAPADEGTNVVRAEAVVQVRQPKLKLSQSGPERCLVRSKPRYSLTFSNPSSSITAPVEIRAVFSPTGNGALPHSSTGNGALPQGVEGLKLLSATDGGTWNSASKAIVWTLPPLGPHQERTVSFELQALREGSWRIHGSAQAGPRVDATTSQNVRVEGIPALRFEVVDLEDLIEVGKETTYEIRITNQGTGTCHNLRLSTALSEGLTVTAVNAPMKYVFSSTGNDALPHSSTGNGALPQSSTGNGALPHSSTGNGALPQEGMGNGITFAVFPKLAPKADLVIRIRVRGDKAGDLRFKAQLSSEQLRQPVVKEEATRFLEEAIND